MPFVLSAVHRLSGYYRALFLLLSTVLFTGCAQLGTMAENAIKSPEVVSQTIQIRKMDFNYIYFDADIELLNPNPVALNLDGFNYTLDVEGQQLVTGDNNGLSLKPSGQANISLPFKVRLDSLVKLAPELLKKDQLEYTFGTVLTLNGPLGLKWQKPVTVSKIIATPKLPEIKMPKISLGDVSLSGLQLNVQLPVNNPNMFGVNLEQLSAALVINGMKPVQIGKDSAIRLPAKSETMLDIPLNFSWDSASRSLLSILRDGQLPDIRLEGNWKLDPELPGFQVQQFDFGFEDGRMI